MAKASFRVILNARGSNNKCPVSIRIGYNSKYKRLLTPIEILPDQFDEKAAKNDNWKVIIKHIDKHNLNQLIKSKYDRFFEAVYALEATGEPYTVSTIKGRLEHDNNKAIDVLTKILEQDRSIKKNTKKAISSMIVRLSEFSPDILMHEISYKFTKDFETWLLSKPGRTGQNLSINTVNKYIRDLSRMLDKSVMYEYVNRNPISSYDRIIEHRQPIKTKHINHDQLYLFETAVLPDYLTKAKIDSLQYTLDAFLFAVYTGLRLEDLLLACSAWIEDAIMKLTTSKGKGAYVEIPLAILFEGKALDIVNKYSRLRMPKKPFFRDLSRVTHQMNIRELNMIILPFQKVSFHSARHTFTTLLREQGEKEVIVQRMLGHKSLSTTRNTYDHHSWEADRKQLKEHNI